MGPRYRFMHVWNGARRELNRARACRASPASPRNAMRGYGGCVGAQGAMPHRCVKLPVARAGANEANNPPRARKALASRSLAAA